MLDLEYELRIVNISGTIPVDDPGTLQDHFQELSAIEGESLDNKTSTVTSDPQENLLQFSDSGEENGSTPPENMVVLNVTDDDDISLYATFNESVESDAERVLRNILTVVSPLDLDDFVIDIRLQHAFEDVLDRVEFEYQPLEAYRLDGIRLGADGRTYTIQSLDRYPDEEDGTGVMASYRTEEPLEDTDINGLVRNELDAFEKFIATIES